VAGTVATTASDVYMVGGLAYELLTAGVPPFHWLATDLESSLLLARRRATRDPVPIPGLRVGLPGLLGKSVLQVAEDDGVAVPWRVRSVAGSGGLDGVRGVVTQCLSPSPEDRPKVPTLLASLNSLLAAEAAAVEAPTGPAPCAAPPHGADPVVGGRGGGSGPPATPAGPMTPDPGVCLCVPVGLGGGGRRGGEASVCGYFLPALAPYHLLVLYSARRPLVAVLTPWCVLGVAAVRDLPPWCVCSGTLQPRHCWRAGAVRRARLLVLWS
jgi:hypothetical protein